MFHFLNIIIQKEKFYYFIYGEKIHNINSNNKTHDTSINLKYLGIDPNRQLHSLEENPMYPMKGMNRNTYL